MPDPKTKTINGLEFEISQPYAEGHVCTEAEARALNQTRSENIGNNTRAKIKEMLEAGTAAAEIAAYVAEVDAAYEFTLANVAASRKLDPVEREAQKIARELIKGHLAESGRKLTVPPEGVTEEDWKDKIAGEVERLAATDEILKVAKKNVDAKKKQADQLSEALGSLSV